MRAEEQNHLPPPVVTLVFMKLKVLLVFCLQVHRQFMSKLYLSTSQAPLQPLYPFITQPELVLITALAQEQDLAFKFFGVF